MASLQRGHPASPSLELPGWRGQLSGNRPGCGTPWSPVTAGSVASSAGPPTLFAGLGPGLHSLSFLNSALGSQTIKTCSLWCHFSSPGELLQETNRDK